MSSGTPFERVGGRETVEAIVETFYDAVAADAPRRAIYPDDLAPRREQLAR
ncbi:MAG: globin, partial [Dehalococcoidia bacterium]|nr:globin [Dehalococcoidia bacterium]